MFQGFWLVQCPEEVDQEADYLLSVKSCLACNFLIDSINAPCSTKEFVHCEDDLDICPWIADKSDPEWRAKVREEVFFADADQMEDEIRVKVPCVEEEEERAPEIKPNPEAPQTTEKLLHKVESLS